MVNTSVLTSFGKKFAKVPLSVLLVLALLTLGSVIAYASNRPLSTDVLSVSKNFVVVSIKKGNENGQTGQLIPAPSLPELDAAIAQIEAQYQVSLGLSIAYISIPGREDHEPWQGGTIRTATAWDSADVAVALAVLHESKQPDDIDYLFERALQNASSAGDLALWEFLGTSEQAAEKTTAVLRGVGDYKTQIPETSPEATIAPFTLTKWGLNDQARFMAGLFCSADGWQITDRLVSPASPNDFGFATPGLFKANSVKTGWGTEVNGSVSVRQAAMNVLSQGHTVGLSAVVVSSDRSLSTAEAAMNALAEAVAQYAVGFQGHC